MEFDMDHQKDMPIKKARKLAKAISEQFHITSHKEWLAFMERESSGKFIVIPPTGAGKTYLSFEILKKHIRSLGIKNIQEWKIYCDEQHHISHGIPLHPAKVYKNEWVSWGDFLGTNYKIPSKFLSYKEARKFVRSLKLKNCKEWDKYCKSGEKPKNIPHSPQKIYKVSGWIGWDEFFGSGNYSIDMSDEQIQRDISFVKERIGEGMDDLRMDMTDKEIIKAYEQEATDIIEAVKKYLKDYPREEEKKDLGKFMPFDKARDYVCTLELQSFEEWKEFCDLKDRPKDIPHSPHKIYKEEWMGWNYFLGIGLYRQQFYIEVPYSEIREVIESEIEWDINNIGGMVESFREEFDTDEKILEKYKDEPKQFIDGLKEYLENHPRGEDE